MAFKHPMRSSTRGTECHSTLQREFLSLNQVRLRSGSRRIATVIAGFNGEQIEYADSTKKMEGRAPRSRSGRDQPQSGVAARAGLEAAPAGSPNRLHIARNGHSENLSPRVAFGGHAQPRRCRRPTAPSRNVGVSGRRFVAGCRQSMAMPSLAGITPSCMRICAPASMTSKSASPILRLRPRTRSQISFPGCRWACRSPFSDFARGHGHLSQYRKHPVITNLLTTGNGGQRQATV